MLSLQHLCLQLSGKKTPTTERDVSLKEQREGLEKGDAASKDNNVLGLLQVYFSFFASSLGMYI